MQANTLLGAVVAPTYAPPALVVEGVAVDSFAMAGSEQAAVGQSASPRVGVIMPHETGDAPVDLTVNGELLTGYMQELEDGSGDGSGDGNAGPGCVEDGVVESL